MILFSYQSQKMCVAYPDFLLKEYSFFLVASIKRLVVTYSLVFLFLHHSEDTTLQWIILLERVMNEWKERK